MIVQVVIMISDNIVMTEEMAIFSSTLFTALVLDVRSARFRQPWRKCLGDIVRTIDWSAEHTGGAINLQLHT